MRVRLGFAVAAFLEPEILVVDEVLAVGDADFQNKAIGKMKDISKNSGRTVLFVSHNMIAVKSLCKTGLLLENGMVKAQDTASNIVDLYLKKTSENLRTEFVFEELPYTIPDFDFKTLKIFPNKPMINDDLTIKFGLQINFDEYEGFHLSFDFVSSKEVTIFGSGAAFKKKHDGMVEAQCVIPSDYLNTGVYYINLHVFTFSMRRIYTGEQILSFEVFEDKRDSAFLGEIKGLIRPNVIWKEL
jgi:lipopolysaccharide transport system ATP-binding protein